MRRRSKLRLHLLREALVEVSPLPGPALAEIFLLRSFRSMQNAPPLHPRSGRSSPERCRVPIAGAVERRSRACRKFLAAIALAAAAGGAARQPGSRLAQPSARVRQMILAERTSLQVLENRSDRVSPSLKLPGGHRKSPSLEKDH
ncbi:Hypothetical protein BN69_2865 [Methylocystis sp. SC2]|nr:Hypothetical protein BN69_2865 [Methylocystis sp. SC2]